MRILIVEDDREISRLVESGLEDAGYQVDIASDGESALKLILQTDLKHGVYSAAIIDLMLPEMDGLTLIQKVRECMVQTPVLILSAKRSVNERIEGLQKGGDDYLTKPFVFAELLARVQALLRRSPVSSETYVEVAGLKLNLFSREVHRNGTHLSLQPKEFALLELLMRKPNQVVSKSQILKHVWNYDFDPQTNVVDVLVCRLRNKISDELHLSFIETIRGVGYVVKSHS